MEKTSEREVKETTTEKTGGEADRPSTDAGDAGTGAGSGGAERSGTTSDAGDSKS